MAIPIQTLEEKLESAAVAMLGALADLPEGVAFHRAFDSDEVGEPSILVAVQDTGVPPPEEEIEFPTGNRAMRLGVVFRSHSDFGRVEHNEAVGRLRDALMTDDVSAKLSAEVVAFTAFFFRLEDNVRSPDGNSFTSLLTAEVWAAPSDF